MLDHKTELETIKTNFLSSFEKCLLITVNFDLAVK